MKFLNFSSIYISLTDKIFEEDISGYVANFDSYPPSLSISADFSPTDAIVEGEIRTDVNNVVDDDDGIRVVDSDDGEFVLLNENENPDDPGEL